jgi:hypothetical protein
VLSTPWFLCLYVGFVPLEVSLRILDLLFVHGSTILFKIGLAIIKINEEFIVDTLDDAAMVMQMQYRVARVDESVIKV